MRLGSLALGAIGAFVLGLSGGNPIFAAIGGALCGLAIALSTAAEEREGASSVGELLKVIYGAYGVHAASRGILEVIGSRIDRELVRRLGRGESR